MTHKLVPRRAILLLIAAALVLPIVICVILAAGAVLSAMGDTLGLAVLQRIALAVGILWAIDLVSLLVVLALNTLADDTPSNDHEPLDS
ncbi:MAG TPA: hypothetical protein VE890_14300 [Thermoguttaceae bacterium]|nr:hypothetical protein [Thermoguttaceae bacterium]